MTSKTMVVLLQENSETRGEISSFDYVQDAERFIEGLLEAGYDRLSIRVLEGQDMDVLVTQKPMVSLLGAGNAFQAEALVVEMREAVAATAEDVPDQSTESVELAGLDLSVEQELVSVAAGDTAEPYTRNGVRFSSAFSSEY